MDNNLKTVLVIDGGGRGSALVDAYSKSPHVGKILAVPGNDLMQINTTKEIKTYPGLKTTSIDEILQIAKNEKVDLADVAQDNAVEAGLTDLLRENGFKVTGPSRLAGQIEWDKSWARELIKKTNAPQPDYQSFNNIDDGINYINSQPNKSWFIKASGLAEGKGALPANNSREAISRINELGKFGDSAKQFLIEEWLVGEEFSAFVLSDGKSWQFIGSAQDHKRALDGDQGENTGGMGCSTPPLVVTDEIQQQIDKIIDETLKVLKDEGRPYLGILYLGGIIVPPRHPERPSEGSQVFVIEFNARWGDPEAQVLILGIKNDLFELSMAVADVTLESIKVETDGKSRVVVAGCSKGYPGDYSEVKGKEILGIDDAMAMEGIKFYSAGILLENGKYIASGGRLFYLVAEGRNVIEAREKVYSAMKKISIAEDNLHYRTDIGFRDVARLKKAV